ncbi:Acm1p NDAI_0I02700 [Naumovozyma dairenensis CBS 421]|uniref:Uncharacterized protein n=1 Tax=Naumovozyma dairenensis (strain ATCC 10597 / BCRC 20456 / CBS 421 / NBRC 0211 / NRRL Y-12639) TaxID=1071378 RepID=G0WGC7_NAUDC|nr:hypothetical protein NDAI_0I02700 [Naumovozyma dairenensis CBS 421]CCD26838.1 hypothetical protein NDAI_0I02700 [Naumovozyma dairenensis CBS 421]
MSSPIKRRPVLAGKNVNSYTKGSIRKNGNDSTHSSPSKKNYKIIDYALRRSPIKNVSLSPQRRKPLYSPSKLNCSTRNGTFTMFQETPEARQAILLEHSNMLVYSSSYHDENSFEEVKENMSPSKLNSKKLIRQKPTKKRVIRKPLRDLDISEYKGYIENPHTKETTELNLHTNGKIHLPSFVTPPRKHKLKDYFTTNTHEHDSSASSLHFSQTTDDINENKVVRKLEFEIFENEL